MDERYSIKVRENIVEIHGTLSIEETFDFLNFFEKKGFNSVIVGDENSSFILRNIEEEKDDSTINDSEGFYEKLYNSEKEKNEILRDKIEELKSLIKKLILKDNVTVLNEDRETSRLMTEEEKEIAVKRLKEMQNCHVEIPDPTNYPPKDESISDYEDALINLGKLLIKSIKENYSKDSIHKIPMPKSEESPLPFKNEMPQEDYDKLVLIYQNTI